VALTILVRSYCHLCEDMLAALEAGFPEQRRQHVFAQVAVDVDQHGELEARFGELVPVLLLNGVEVCHYHFDGAALAARLAD
jgi:glutaredoxin